MRLFTTSLAVLALTGTTAFAQAIIDNGTVQLGVGELGQLNVPGGVPSPVTGTTAVGLRYLPTGNESTSHGCECEGWGVGIGETLETGYANNSSGTAGLTPVSFASDATSATSVVELGTSLRITHTFTPAAETPFLYRVSVSIENISLVDIADLRYTRTFDWDIEPTTFTELVTHAGVLTTGSLLASNDNGFEDLNPFASRSEIVAGTTDTNFVDSGPDDHGSNFDFGFGALLAGETFDFDIFYGAAGTEREALVALNAVGAELFSLGQCSGDAAGTGAGGCNTFMFGFAGVGGVVIPVDPVPVPAGGLLIITGLGALGLIRRRKARAA